MVKLEQDEVRRQLKDGRLKDLNVKNERGILVTRGRFTTDRLLMLTGRKALPVLLASSRLAVLLCVEAHAQDHYREASSILARTRRKAWLVGGR